MLPLLVWQQGELAEYAFKAVTGYQCSLLCGLGDMVLVESHAGAEPKEPEAQAAVACVAAG